MMRLLLPSFTLNNVMRYSSTFSSCLALYRANSDVTNKYDTKSRFKFDLTAIPWKIAHALFLLGTPKARGNDCSCSRSRGTHWGEDPHMFGGGCLDRNINYDSPRRKQTPKEGKYTLLYRK